MTPGDREPQRSWQFRGSRSEYWLLMALLSLGVVILGVAAGIVLSIVGGVGLFIASAVLAFRYFGKK